MQGWICFSVVVFSINVHVRALQMVNITGGTVINLLYSTRTHWWIHHYKLILQTHSKFKI